MRFIVAGLLVVMSVTAGIAQTNVLRFTDYAMVQPVVNPACMEYGRRGGRVITLPESF